MNIKNILAIIASLFMIGVAALHVEAQSAADCQPGGHSYGLPICDASNWPPPGGPGKDMQWCTNGAHRTISTECQGASLCIMETTYIDRCPIRRNSGRIQAAVHLAIRADDGDGCVAEEVGKRAVNCFANSVACGYTPPVCNPSSCVSAPNACGQTAGGTVGCGHSCSAVTPANPSNLGRTCTASNSCGRTSTGSYQCDGSCSAVAPSESLCAPACAANRGQSCTARNSCGRSATGVYQCDGSCSAVAPSESLCPTTPSCVSNVGRSCSASNSCGRTSSGVIACDGSCTARAPSESLCASACSPSRGALCMTSNACGTPATGVTACDGSCPYTGAITSPSMCTPPPVTPPVAPPVIPVVPTCAADMGDSCDSAPNSCGMTNSGIIGCSGSCSARRPSNALCAPPTPPTPPVLSVTPPRDYLDIAVGDSQTFSVPVTNSGGGSLTCTASIIDPSGHFSITPPGDANINNLNSGQFRDVRVTFTPTLSNTGVNATLRFNCSSPSVSRDYALYGRGALALSLPDTINLGEVPAGLTRYFSLLTVKNNRTTAANVCIVVPRRGGDDSSFGCDLRTTQCSRMTASGASSKFRISFAPQAPTQIPKGYRKEMSTTVTLGFQNPAGVCVPMAGGLNTVTVTATAVEPVFDFRDK